MRMTGKVKNKNKKKSQAAAVWRRLKKNKMAVLGLIILAVIIFFAVFADVFFDYETLVIQQNASLKLQPPSVEHWLGTDDVGRDVLARLICGARISLPVAFATIAIATVVGGLLGAIAGYGSRRVDDVIMRVMDIFLAIPSILLSIALVHAVCLRLACAPGTLRRGLERLYQSSFFVYLSHCLFLTLGTYFLQRRGVGGLSVLLAARLLLCYTLPFLAYFLYDSLCTRFQLRWRLLG